MQGIRSMCKHGLEASTTIRCCIPQEVLTNYIRNLLQFITGHTLNQHDKYTTLADVVIA